MNTIIGNIKRQCNEEKENIKDMRNELKIVEDNLTNVESNLNNVLEIIKKNNVSIEKIGTIYKELAK